MPRSFGWSWSFLLGMMALAGAWAPWAAATHTEGSGLRGIDLIFGGSLRHAETNVLIVPPQHGDLGNPLGPTVVDYLQATLDGFHQWETAMHRFAADHPQYGYLADVTVKVAVADTPGVGDPAGFDVVVGYVASFDRFRGLATETHDSQQDLDGLGVGAQAHGPGRAIVLSLFASSPRAHQQEADFPEVNDLYSVTLHEFAHTWGLGHTLTRLPGATPVDGYDLMNSPAPFVYGDGATLGDGGERTAKGCISTLDLYGMAVLYRWLPSGVWQESDGRVSLPPDLPYALYC